MGAINYILGGTIIAVFLVVLWVIESWVKRWHKSRQEPGKYDGEKSFWNDKP